MKIKMIKVICIIVCLFLPVSSFVILQHSENFNDSTLKNASPPGIVINAKDFLSSSDNDIEIFDELDGVKEALYTGETGMTRWNFEVEEEGYYNIFVRYFPVTGKTTSIERSIYINDTLPSDSFRNIIFKRFWTNKTEILTDSRGNELRPVQVEKPMWKEVGIQTSSLLYGANLSVYLDKGTSSIAIEGIKEPMAIDYIRFEKETDLIRYADLEKKYLENGYEWISGNTIVIQGQDAVLKSDPVLYPINDRTSPKTTPSDHTKIKMNTIGGYNWRYPGQWITWSFNVEKAGLYRIDIRARQNFTSGNISTRKLFVNGEIPFYEAQFIEFDFQQNWYIKTPGNEGKDFLFYFNEGENTITLENTTGNLSGILRRSEEIVFELNDIYRRILMVTGAFPDPNRDYRLERIFPDMLENFSDIVDEIVEIKLQLMTITSETGISFSNLDRLEIQLMDFVSRPETIPVRLDRFRINVSNLSEWILSAVEQPLLIDSIAIVTNDGDTLQGESGFFSRLWFEIRAFLASFFEDYSIIGEDGEYEKSVTLWLGSAIGAAVLGSGRDQAQIIHQLTDNFFTPQTDIKVNVRLVDMNVLIPAVATNNGPDVAIGQDRAMPLNYAYRGALKNLSDFDEIETVLERFHPESIVSFRAENGVFALPETYTFLMMFYRKDILDELNLNVPVTWEDVFEVVPILHNNNLDIGFPSVVDDNLDIFLTLLFQNGGNVYTSGRDGTELSSNTSIEAFTKWTNFYTKYRVAQTMNHLTRFRTGEAPIVLMPYTFFNLLVAAAPEINGLWDFTLVPGTVQDDGEISHSVVGTGTGSVIFRNASDMDAAWQFLKWWSSAETQFNYGLEIENLQGPSGRWPTANLEAFEFLPWSVDDRDNIVRQRDYSRGLEEVPGGYITTRYVGTALRLVVNSRLNPRETMLDWDRMINDEIRAKRIEFGLE